MDTRRKNLTVHKTFKLSDAEWAEFRLLIGWRGLWTITDIIIAGLKRLSAERLADLAAPHPLSERLAVAPPAGSTGAGPEPVAPQDPPPADVVADVQVTGYDKCRGCSRTRPLNSHRLCASCELVRHSGGKVTTGDKIPPPSKNGKKRSTAKPKRGGVPPAKGRAKKGR